MIRAAPFSGESSDSSDDEHGTPKKSPQPRLGGKMSMLNALLGSKGSKNSSTSEPENKKGIVQFCHEGLKTYYVYWQWQFCK